MALTEESLMMALGLLLNVPIEVRQCLVEFQYLPRNLSMMIMLAQGLYKKA
jgi:hypothetical protein